MVNNGCVFCKIVKKEIPSSVVFEDDNVIVFKNIQPVAEHHYLVCPKKHVSNLLEVGSEILDMTIAFQHVVKTMKLESGYKLVINGGKYQSVPHLHMHLLSGKLEDQDDIINNT